MQDQQSRSVSEKFFNKTMVFPKDNQNNSTNILTKPSGTEDSEDEYYSDNEELNDKKEILYLDQDILSMNFGDFMDTNITYTIYLGIYRINSPDTDFPFIEFLLDTSGETAIFPNIINFHCPSTYNTNENNDTEEHTYFMNECLETLLDTFPKLNIRNFVYKGYMDEYQDETTHNIFVMFEVIPSANIDFLPSTLSWAILDEIMYRKEYNKIPIQSQISNFFLNNSHMTNLHFTQDNSPLPLPFLGYLCRDLLYNVEMGESILDTTYNHPSLGDFHFFSSFPLETTTTTLQRYVIFPVEPAIFILKDISTISQEQKDEFFKKYQDQEVVTLYFHENNIQYWCIKSTHLFLKLQ